MDKNLPEQYRGKGTMITEAGNTIRVYDLDLSEWRSFRIDSVTNVSADYLMMNQIQLNG
jgi:hypothetical protein